MRCDEQLSIRQIQDQLGVTKQQLAEWLRGVPAPEWTRRPNAKDEVRKRALELRVEGWSVNDIALELGVAKSTVWLWVKHLPLDPDTERAARKREHSKLMADAQWAAYREARDARHAATVGDAAAWVGSIDQRELLLVGAIAYWCEGAKAKLWRPHYTVQFINSDPSLVELFLRFVEAAGFPRDRLKYRVSIHESADAAGATAWWAERVDVPVERFQRPTLKRHNPMTSRYNIGSEYHGCLVVAVPKGRDLYWRIEGIVQGIIGR